MYNPEYGDSLDGCIPPGLRSQIPEERFANVKAAYAGEVSLVDRWTGHLLEALKDSGRLDDTLVVFTSDHGCMMGEQGQVHKGYDRLRNQVTRVPLFIRHPGGEGAGTRVPEFCQHQDIMPTVLNLLGEPVPERVTGRNIWPATTDPGKIPDYVVSAFAAYACIRTHDWNYVCPWRPLAEGAEPKYELYDLRTDPQELTNVIAAHESVAGDLSRRLEDHTKRFHPLTGGSFQGLGEGTDRMSFDALPRLDAG